MKVYLGMTRQGMRKFASEMLAQCDSDSDKIAVKLAIPYDGMGPMMKLTVHNWDLGNPRDDEATAFWLHA
jgi:hypothetical protein